MKVVTIYNMTILFDMLQNSLYIIYKSIHMYYAIYPLDYLRILFIFYFNF